MKCIKVSVETTVTGWKQRRLVCFSFQTIKMRSGQAKSKSFVATRLNELKVQDHIEFTLYVYNQQTHLRMETFVDQTRLFIPRCSSSDCSTK